MNRLVALSGAGLCLLLLGILAVSGCFQRIAAPAPRIEPASLIGTEQPPTAPKAVAKPAPPPVMQPLAVGEVLRAGTLIVVSKASQRLFVFRDGALWQTAPVSTGRRGHTTPSGVFPILQKALMHRSNKYSNAPMPFMQRLTWDGIAIHAGRLPGYAASHGCIRVPYAFARALYAETKAARTTVVVTDAPLDDEGAARELAMNAPAPKALRAPDQPARGGALASAGQGAAVPPRPLLPAPRPRPPSVPTNVPPKVPPSPRLPGETIQLAAAASPALAEAQWSRLVAAHPELSGFQKSIEPAVVNARQTYRLRASAPSAHATCAALQKAKVACFNVH